MQTHDSCPDSNVATLINQLIASRRITLRQYQELSAAVLADGAIDEQERYQINRLFDAIQNGAVKFVR